MKKILLGLAVCVFVTPVFSYDLTDADRALIDSFEPKIQQIYNEDTERFDTILDKLDTIIPQFAPKTREHEVLAYLYDVMHAFILLPVEEEVLNDLLAEIFANIDLD